MERMVFNFHPQLTSNHTELEQSESQKAERGEREIYSWLCLKRPHSGDEGFDEGLFEFGLFTPGGTFRIRIFNVTLIQRWPEGRPACLCRVTHTPFTYKPLSHTHSFCFSWGGEITPLKEREKVSVLKSIPQGFELLLPPWLSALSHHRRTAFIARCEEHERRRERSDITPRQRGRKEGERAGRGWKRRRQRESLLEMIRAQTVWG